MKRYLIAILLAIASLTGGIVLAATQYSAPVAITENASTAYTMLPVMWDSPNVWLADNNYMSPTANDTRVETLGGVAKPHMVADNKTLTAIPVGANSQTNLFFTTWNTALDAMNIVLGYGGHITTTDNASLEPSDNSTVSYSGHIDMSATDNIIWEKENALSLKKVSDNITVTIGVEEDWVTPTSHSDPDTGWNNETNAYDNNTSTYATSDIIGSGAWTDYFIFIYEQDLTIDGIRFYYEASNTDDNVDIDSYYDASWHNEYDANNAIENTWVTAQFSDNITADRFRIRFQSNSGGAQEVYLKEVDFKNNYYQLTTAVVSSGEYDINVGMDSPFFGVAIDTDLELPVTENLTMNAPMGQSEEYAAPSGNFTTIDSNAFVVDVSGAVWALNEGYEFDGTDDYLEVAHDASQLYTRTIEVWIYPASLGESNAGDIFDKSTGTNGRDGYSLRMGSSNRIIFFIDEVGEATPGDAVTLNAWNHVVATWDVTGHAYLYINGVNVSNDPTSDPVNITTTNAPRVGQRTGHTDQTFDGKISEVRTYDRQLTPDEVLQNYNATKSKYSTGDIYTYSTLSSVPDNANDWSFMGDATPYADYIKTYVGGNLVLHYEPTSMINGTFMPDRAIGNSGVITWGSNPPGVGATLGSMTSSATVTTSTDEETSRDLLPATEVSDWFGDGTVTKAATLANPLRSFITAISDNTTLSEIQVWRWMGIIMVIFMTMICAKALRGHQGITAIIAGVLLGGLVAFDYNIFPLWLLIISLGGFIGGLIAERTPSV